MAQAKGRRDGPVSSNEIRRRPLSSGEVEGVSWQGPRNIYLHKNSQGFGFTLRHFIVYPPESSVSSLKDEENGNSPGKGCQRMRLEPMDTIFVKSVKEHGPAHQAGLCTGDRLVKVNGESILGRTYSQVIALIQNSENVLELSIMPKDEDVLQLVYSQDAYLAGGDPCGAGTRSLPRPPALCYPPGRPGPKAAPPCPGLQAPPDNWRCRPGPAPSPLDNRPLADEPGGPGRPRGRSSSALGALDFHFANHNAALAAATLPPPRKSSLPANDRLCQRALSDWYHSQAEAAEQLPPRHRSLSPERLAELGLGLALSPGPPGGPSAEQQRREALLYHQRAAALHGASWPGGPWCPWSPGAPGGPWAPGDPGGRRCSEDLLAAYAEYEHNYGRSVETLARASAMVPPRPCGQPRKPKAGPPQPPPTPPSAEPPPARQPGQQVAEPQTRRVRDEDPAGLRGRASPGPPGPPPQQPQPGCGPRPHWSPGEGAGPRPQSTPALPVEEPLQDRDPASPVSLNQEVVLRQKPRRPSSQALRHTLHSSPADPPEAPGPSPPPGPGGPARRTNGGLAQQAYDSLASIPFIGSIKSRRSSYLLAITTERSKSCDEGLNTFREEGRVLSKLPKRVKSFFMDGSLESLRAQEDARAKRHSTSELGTITFSDVRKEGWFHYKQILTEKGKKVGGAMRPWKRVFSVLRSHSLFLYKDKRESVLQGPGSGPGAGPGPPGQDEHPPISIRGCLIDIAYSETKRKHTLRLTTQDFCEYLLQAEDRDDMLAWIRVIRENSKTDNEEISSSRHALINKKLNDYRKQSLSGNKLDSSPRGHRMMAPFLLAKTDNTSTNRPSRTDDNKALWGINIMKKAKKTCSPKAFGVRLEDCQPAVNHKFVPLIVEMCCGVVESTGLEYTGIYRVPGNNAMVSNLQEHLNKGLDITSAEERWQDLNVISSLLKSFFRKLPEPLFTDDKYNDFIDANRIKDTEDRLKTMKKLIHDLPDHYYHTLQFLVGHLKKVADNSEKNKMKPSNLALVFGPTLVRTSEDNMIDMVTHMPDRCKIVETLILHYDWFFSDGELDKEEKAPEDKHDMQPVPSLDHLLPNIGRPGMPGEASDSTTSDSLKSKVSSGPKKDLNARDFLPKSLISAVTRKRKKSPSGRLAGSGAGEDSDHEPVKASNYGEGGGGEEEGGAEGEQKVPEKEKMEEPGDGSKPSEPTEEREGCGDTETREGGGDVLRGFGRDGGAKVAPQPRPHSFHSSYSHHQVGASCPRPPRPSLQRPPGPARERPAVPFWISPSRLPNHYQAPGLHGARQQDRSHPVPVCYRKTRGPRTRALSMNLDLELGGREDGETKWRTEKVEVIRVLEGFSGQHGCVGVPRGSVFIPGSVQQMDRLPQLAHEAPSPFSSSSGWMAQPPAASPSVVLRRTALNPQNKNRAWRRHTVVV